MVAKIAYFIDRFLSSYATSRQLNHELYRATTVSKCVGTVSKCVGTVSKWVGTVSKCVGTVSKCVGTVSKCVGTVSKCVGTVSKCVGKELYEKGGMTKERLLE